MGFGEKKSCLLGVLKAWDPFINHMTINYKQLISNIKLDRALEYIKCIRNDHPHSHKNKKLCYMDKKVTF
jgi:hypothetical protein